MNNNHSAGKIPCGSHEESFIRFLDDLSEQRGGWSFLDEDGWGFVQNTYSDDEPLLVRQMGISPVTSSIIGMAAVNNWLVALEYILSKGSKIDLKDSRGETPLHKAVFWGNGDSALFLIERGADVDARNNDGMSPLHLSVFKNSIAIAGLLIGKGVNVNCLNNRGETPLFVLRNYIFMNVLPRHELDRVLLDCGGVSIKITPDKREKCDAEDDTSFGEAMDHIRSGIVKQDEGDYNAAIRHYTWALRKSVGIYEVSSLAERLSAESYLALGELNKALMSAEMAVYLNENDEKAVLLRDKIKNKLGMGGGAK